MSAYPKNLQYITKRISNYTRATKRLSTLNSTSANNNGVITVDLPSNTMIDTDSVIMTSKAITDVGGFPRNAESIVQRCDLEINGQVIGGFSNYNQLFNIIADTSFGADCHNRRKIVQSGGDGTGIPNPTEPKDYCICNWLTLNSFQPPPVYWTHHSEDRSVFESNWTDPIVLLGEDNSLYQTFHLVSTQSQ